MGRRLNNFIIRYTWLFPLIILIGAVFYYLNWFERLFAEDKVTYMLPIYKELQISIGILLFTTAVLNWALIGFWKHICTTPCRPKWEKKHASRK